MGFSWDLHTPSAGASLCVQSSLSTAAGGGQRQSHTWFLLSNRKINQSSIINCNTICLDYLLLLLTVTDDSSPLHCMSQFYSSLHFLCECDIFLYPAVQKPWIQSATVKQHSPVLFARRVTTMRARLHSAAHSLPQHLCPTSAYKFCVEATLIELFDFCWHPCRCGTVLLWLFISLQS